MVGLTIVAAGTSMPEVATSIVAAVKKERDISVGITGVMAPTGITVPASVMNFDLWVMLVVSFACVSVF